MSRSLIPFEAVCDSRDRTEWLKQRRSGVGASDIAALIGASRWASPLSLYADKLGLSEEQNETERMEWGNRLEPIIIQAFGERTGRDSRPFGILLRSTEHPFALATLDAWTGEGGEQWPLEIKTTGSHMAGYWTDGPPADYVAQANWQMLVTGTSRASIACLIGGQRLVWCDLVRDESLIRTMVRAAGEFWKRVERQEPPEADGSDATRAALKALYPMEQGEPIALDADFCAIADELEAAKRGEAAAKESRERAENLIKAAMRDAPKATLPDGRSFSYVTISRHGYEVKPTTYRKFTAHRAKEDR